MAAPKKNKTQPPATVQNFPIVGIGASAGGLDAFKRLLTAIPESSGMAYVLVQHLDPSHESILPEILQRVTKIPVHEITEDIHLAPNHIYIIPSNKILTSTDGVLQLTPREKKILNLSIDIFFTSLANVHKEFAVGVVLSGTGSDGTLGLKAIKEHGGISIAQDTESATYDSMPQSAVNAGVVDFILAPEKIPAQLLKINRAYKTSYFFKDEEEIPKDDEYIFKQIILLLRQRSGVDFTYYKQPTFHRRIARRIAITKREKLADYLNFLRTDKAEQDALFQDVLIPVTSFFRDPKTFQTLTETVFPDLFKNKSTDEPIRVWIAACSTGEEAFSIAICLHEFLGEKLSDTRIQIFASDISEKAIKKARAAIYTKADVENISAIQLKNYFVKNNDGYEVNKLIRDMCVFAPHNFLKDPPFAKMDLITCRNVLIYMDTFLQKKAFTTFHYALKESGFLLLGKSETTGASSDLFTQVDKQEKIYSRKPVPGRFMHVATERKEEFFVTKDKTATKQEGTQTDFRKSAEAIMISKSPASVVVNEQMDIVHIHGSINPFLEAPQGKPTHNLTKMAREGLAFELRNAIHKATKEQATVTKENIPVKANGKQSLVTIEIIPLTDTIEPHYLIRFEKKITPDVQEGKKLSSGKIIETQKHNQQLEKELLQTREDMRFITEDMEAANEELQSANEELQSSNEEMQSLNEELETSKEELQSSNEELLIVNQELLDKQVQLNASHLEQVEARKLIEASEKEQNKLAKQLKLATDSAKIGIWSLDIVSSKLEWSNIHKKMWGYDEHREGLTYVDWHKVIVPEDKELAFQRIEESKVNHGIYEADYRINRANDGAIVWIKSTGQYYYDEFGIAHTLTGISIDITEQKEAEQKLKESEARSRAFVESNVVAVCFTHMETATIFEANNAYLNMLGYTQKDLKEGKINWLSYTPPEHQVNDHLAIEKAKSMKISPPYEKEIMRADGKRISVIKARAIINKNEIMSVFVDITERKSAEQKLKTFSKELEAKVNERTAALKESNEELKQTNLQLDQFAYVASHDLQEPLRKILTFSKILQNDHKAGLSTAVKSYLNKIEGASSRMTTIIHDLLNYSRLLQHEKLFVQTDLNETLKNILSDFELLIQEKNAEIKSDILPKIEAIPLLMNQLFYNLISNALKFSKENVPPVITITSRILSEKQIKKYPALSNNVMVSAVEPKSYIEIIFKDNGIGFEQKYAKKIFTIFQRLHNQETYTGTGIGLALTKKIIENHLGEMFAVAKENKGAEFHVILPITQS